MGIYGDGTQPYTEYVRPGEDVNEYLETLGQFFKNKVNGEQEAPLAN